MFHEQYVAVVTGYRSHSASTVSPRHAILVLMSRSSEPACQATCKRQKHRPFSEHSFVLIQIVYLTYRLKKI
jgi:hypothetical protein